MTICSALALNSQSDAEVQQSVSVGNIDIAKIELSQLRVAEGVETEAELAALNAISAMSIQGFYFSRALPEYELTPLIEHNLKSRRVVNLPARF